MIVIEIRVGREGGRGRSGVRTADARDGTDNDRDAAGSSAEQPRVLRVAPPINSGRWFAAAAGFVTAVLLGFLVDRTGLESRARANAPIRMAAPVAAQAPHETVEQRAAELIRSAERSLARQAAPPELLPTDITQLAPAGQTDTLAAAAPDQLESSADDLDWLDAAIHRDVSGLAIGVDGEAPAVTVTAEPPRSDDVGELALASPASEPTESSRAAAPAPAQPKLRVVRSEPTLVDRLERQLRSAAEQQDWHAVAALRSELPADAVLLAAKWDARIALAQHDAASAVAALDAVTPLLDDEANQLRAAALLANGESARAVDAYRALVTRVPNDARLWLGLGLALRATDGRAQHVESTDATAANSAIVAAEPTVGGSASDYALGQSAELAEDPRVRAAANAQRRVTGESTADSSATVIAKFPRTGMSTRGG